VIVSMHDVGQTYPNICIAANYSTAKFTPKEFKLKKFLLFYATSMYDNDIVRFWITLFIGIAYVCTDADISAFFYK